jgi:hypothetical protein
MQLRVHTMAPWVVMALGSIGHIHIQTRIINFGPKCDVPSTATKQAPSPIEPGTI